MIIEQKINKQNARENNRTINVDLNENATIICFATKKCPFVFGDILFDNAAVTAIADVVAAD